MAKVGGYKISDIYQGGYSSLKSNYGDLFTNHRLSAGSLGMATDPRTANILKETSDKLAPGNKVIELSLITPEVFESIPQQHLKEVNRLAKLTGAEITIHGPLLEASGITREGYSDQAREAVERQMKQVIERSHEVIPEGGPVTFHSSAQLPGPDVTLEKIDGKMVEKEHKVLVINQETGQINVAKAETKFYPSHPESLTGKKGEGKTYSAREEIGIMNDSDWDQNLSQLVFYKERADEIIRKTYPQLQGIDPEILIGKKERKYLTQEEQELLGRLDNAREYLKNTHLSLSGLFNKAYKYGDEKTKEDLRRIAKEFEEKIYIKKDGEKYNNYDPKAQSEAMQLLISNLQGIDAPEVFKPLDDFARDKTTTTFANTALHGYMKWGEKAPIVSIENPPAGGGFSRGEDLKTIVEESRKKFIEEAKKKGKSEQEAREAAEKLIGVTWDVGHINMLKKHGFGDKELVEETKKVAPLVKHVHLSDNFGMEHTELPMGMGNVPFKDMMKQIEQAGFKGKEIIETGNWWQHFSPGGLQNSPFIYTLEAMGSPIYGMEMGAGSPYWNQRLGLHQDYFGGMGEMLPSINYETFGAGFSQLPAELGGQRQSAAGGRMSGRPME